MPGGVCPQARAGRNDFEAASTKCSAVSTPDEDASVRNRCRDLCANLLRLCAARSDARSARFARTKSARPCRFAPGLMSPGMAQGSPFACDRVLRASVRVAKFQVLKRLHDVIGNLPMGSDCEGDDQCANGSAGKVASA